MKIFKALEIAKKGQLSMPFSGIQLSQFYGIEIDDFAGEIAKLALWLAEHQMNVEFFKEFGRTNPTLPLKEAGKIVQGNATRLDWEVVCPKTKDSEIYILGNPPYLGSRNQNKEQKEDMKAVFLRDYKSLDYIACWFYLGANYIRGINSKCAFVSTNSVSQGEQVSLTWQRVLEGNIEICFAHQSFKWQNNAKTNANVIVVVIGLSNKSNDIKTLFKSTLKMEVNSINPYLAIGNTIYVNKRKQQLSDLPLMTYGNMPLEGGFLRFKEDEKNKLINIDNRILKYIRKVIGGEEFLKGINRYCLWIENESLEEALEVKNIKDRIDLVKEFRKNGGDVARTLVDRSHQFRYRNEPINNQIVVPCTSSENRSYIPCGFFDNSYISLNSIQTINDAKPFVLGIISSNMHMVWMKTVAGRLKTDYRYSSALVYNTFPFPNISTQRKNEITQSVFRILEEREKHSDKTLAQLYDPDKMPEGLRKAHRQNDIIIEKCYRSTPFKSDEERLEYLFKLYEKMIAEEKEQGALLAKKNKSKRKKKK